jgi:hypothetical protein
MLHPFHPTVAHWFKAALRFDRSLALLGPKTSGEFGQ